MGNKFNSKIILSVDMTNQVAKFVFQISIILMTTNKIAAMDNGKRFDDSKEVTGSRESTKDI
jgi:hypothetical protein